MIRSCVALFIVAAAPAAMAQSLSPAPTPGLWESRTKMLVNGQDMGEMMRKAQEEMLKSVPPEQRKQMAEMMRAHGGGGMMGGTTQDCLTPQEAARATDLKRMFADMHKEQPGCRFEPIKAGGSSATFKVSCKDPEGFTGDGQGEIRILDAKSTTWHYEGTGRMQGMDRMPPGMKAPGGAPGAVKIQVDSTSRWVAASCGNVK